MFEEKFEKERFSGYLGMDAFIDEILSIPDQVTQMDIDEISELLEHL